MGKCYCNPGFQGDSCEEKSLVLCPGDGFCGSHGICNHG
jgi:hypothetical protein